MRKRYPLRDVTRGDLIAHNSRVFRVTLVYKLGRYWRVRYGPPVEHGKVLYETANWRTDLENVGYRYASAAQIERVAGQRKLRQLAGAGKVGDLGTLKLDLVR